MKNPNLFQIRILLVGLVAMLASACGSSITIQTLRPAPNNLGANQKIDILHTTGRRSARETVIAQLQQQARTRGFFQVKDASEKGIEVKIAGRTVTLSDGSMVPAGTVGMRIDVLEWGANKETKTEEYIEKGKKRTRSRSVYTGKALLGVTVFNASGKAVLAEKEYEGRSSMGSGNANESAARDMAGVDAVRRLLNDITPLPVRFNVKLDSSDKGQKDIIKAAEAGNLPKATADLKAYLKANPNNPAGTYNLAVFTDATGDYTTALGLYDKAIQGNPKADWYSDARQGCAKRQAQSAALTE